MKFNKVIREYMEEQLNKKRIQANEEDELKIDYEKRRKNADKEIKELLISVYAQINQILEVNGMDIKGNHFEGENTPACEYILRYFEGDIRNITERKKIREKEDERYKYQQQLMKEIELECALGADKQKFLNMIEKVKFN